MIGLKVTITKGSTVSNETEYFFDQEHRYIVLGCDPNVCDIVFIEDHREQGVGNEHIAFKRSLGRYQLDINTDHYVVINGEAPFEDQEIAGKSIVGLGDSVTLEIEVIDNRKNTSYSGKKLIQPGAQVKKNKRYIWGAFSGIAILSLALFMFSNNLFEVEKNITVTQENINQAVKNITDLSAELDRVEVLADTISQATIQKVTQSVYLVLIQNNEGGERPAGTAWVFSDSQLATNAHVAAAFSKLKENEQLIVRSSIAPYKTHVVKNALLHPGFERFQTLWNSYLPVQKMGERLIKMVTASPADVAILELTSSEGLNPPIPLANLDELDQILPGKKVAFVGYPSEKLLPGDMKRPSPVVQQDEIVRVTDFFLNKQANENNRLIHHGLPLTGGASGSPMFNSKGEAIGLISAMNISIDSSGRTPHAADINIGQRIDFLYDLINNNTDGTLAQLETNWQESLSQFDSGIEESKQNIIENIKSIFSLHQKNSEKIINMLATTNSKSVVEKTQKFSVNIDSSGLHLILLEAPKPIKRFKAEPLNNVHISTYRHPIKYSEYAHYALVFANEPGQVNIQFSPLGAYKKDEELSYTIKLLHWEANINEISNNYIQHLGTLYSKSKAPFELIRQVESAPMAEAFKAGYFTAFSLTLEDEGHYAFLSVPQEKGSVNTILIDETKKQSIEDKTPNSIGRIVFKNTQKNRQVKFVSYGKDPDIIQTMQVFFVADE